MLAKISGPFGVGKNAWAILTYQGFIENMRFKFA